MRSLMTSHGYYEDPYSMGQLLANDVHISCGSFGLNENSLPDPSSHVLVIYDRVLYDSRMDLTGVHFVVTTINVSHVI